VIARPLKKFRSVNANTSAYPSLVDTLDEPVGDAGTAAGRAIVDVGLRGNGIVPRFLELWPYAAASANDTFDLRVVAWQRILPQLSDGRYQWTPFTLAEFHCTIGAMTGIAGGVVADTELYVDTITIAAEETVTADVTRMGSVYVFSPANDTKAHIRFDLEGVEKVELIFDQTLNSPTMNALYRFYDRFDD
jgi:hypothetical protein